MTGAWAGGEFMKRAIQFAEDIINQQQLLLPGFQLRSHFYDDQCDPDRAVSLVLQKQADNEDFIALGGMGCEAACTSTASVTMSVRLPFISYECTGPELP